ncbi:hypothetical protein FOZ60_010340 [Perkinsus olseni]|uniref:Peptidase A1 domain-containing protein n=1 Tax=Perkinsus olseni TaxID=32597 RepID=A0A7J6PCK2_PEROL|nr:hypothetical protein FOZ60_010340 [Perkinsus olseni]
MLGRVNPVWVIVLMLTVWSIAASGTIRVHIILKKVETDRLYETLITAPVKADGQSLSLLVDTGSPKFFIIEQHFGRTRSFEVCEIFGCYECSTDLCEGKVAEVSYADETYARIVQHRGTLELGDRFIPGAEFGLVVEFKPETSIVHASLGLGLYPYGAEMNNTPIMEQLTGRGLIGRDDFSIYFKPESRQGGVEEGELILGGEDPSKYSGPMLNARLFPFANEWIVGLEGFVVGGQLMSKSNLPVYIDSGTSRFWLPHDIFNTVLHTLEASATAPSGRTIEFEEIREGRFALPNCSDRAYLPPLQLYLRQDVFGRNFSNIFPDKLDSEEWPIVIPPELYVHYFARQQRCILFLGRDPKGSKKLSSIGVSLLRNYYLHFQNGRRQIQFAEVAKTHDPLKSAEGETHGQKRRRERSGSLDTGERKRLRVEMNL